MTSSINWQASLCLSGHLSISFLVYVRESFLLKQHLSPYLSSLPPGSILSSASVSIVMEAGLTHWNKQQKTLMCRPFILDLTICLASQSHSSFFIVLTLLSSRPVAMALDVMLPWYETTTQMVASLSVLPFSLPLLFSPCSFSLSSINQSVIFSVYHLLSAINSIIYPNCHLSIIY